MSRNLWITIAIVMVVVLLLITFWKVLLFIGIIGGIGYGVFKLFGKNVKDIFK